MPVAFDWRKVWVSLTRADPLAEQRGNPQPARPTGWPPAHLVAEWEALKAEVFASQLNTRNALDADGLIDRLNALKRELAIPESSLGPQSRARQRCLHHIQEALDEAQGISRS